MPKRSEKRDTAKAEYIAKKKKGEEVSLRALAGELGVSYQMRGLNRCRVAALGQRGRAGAGIGDRRRHLPRVRALSQQRQPGPVRGKP